MPFDGFEIEFTIEDGSSATPAMGLSMSSISDVYCLDSLEQGKFDSAGCYADNDGGKTGTNSWTEVNVPAEYCVEVWSNGTANFRCVQAKVELSRPFMT